jgi:hypothetical protein
VNCIFLSLYHFYTFSRAVRSSKDALSNPNWSHRHWTQMYYKPKEISNQTAWSQTDTIAVQNQSTGDSDKRFLVICTYSDCIKIDNCPRICQDRWLQLHTRRMGLSLEVFTVVKDTVPWIWCCITGGRCPAFWDQKYFKVYNKW